MYIHPEMVDMGLEDGQEWPSSDHRFVAQNLALCNSAVCTREALTEVVQAVIAIPSDRIKSVTLNDCRYEFHVPYIE